MISTVSIHSGMAISVAGVERETLVRRGQWLSWLTLGYNSLEGAVAIGAGVLAGSIALVGFGFDSVIEVTASVAALWRLNADVDPIERERAERLTLKVVGILWRVRVPRSETRNQPRESRSLRSRRR